MELWRHNTQNTIFGTNQIMKQFLGGIEILLVKIFQDLDS